MTSLFFKKISLFRGTQYAILGEAPTNYVHVHIVFIYEFMNL